jgi:protein Tex
MHGRFPTRAALKQVTRLGPKAFELCAGFLRIPNGEDPLDASGVHPEAYPVVQRILATTKTDLKTLIGNAPLLRTLAPDTFTDETFGVPTVTDILRELEKPGRDPRPAFWTASFREGVEKLEDLEAGMLLEGVVTNVAAFGAFVDIGVHQDGLVHISAMSKTFVKDPRALAKPGDIVRVKVLDIDPARRRIALTMRLDEADAQAKSARSPESKRRDESKWTDSAQQPTKVAPVAPAAVGGAIAEALRRAGSRAGSRAGKQGSNGNRSDRRR